MIKSRSFQTETVKLGNSEYFVTDNVMTVKCPTDEKVLKAIKMADDIVTSFVLVPIGDKVTLPIGNPSFLLNDHPSSVIPNLDTRDITSDLLVKVVKAVAFFHEMSVTLGAEVLNKLAPKILVVQVFDGEEFLIPKFFDFTAAKYFENQEELSKAVKIDWNCVCELIRTISGHTDDCSQDLNQLDLMEMANVGVFFHCQLRLVFGKYSFEIAGTRMGACRSLIWPSKCDSR